jgi:hypothetical protein
LQLKENIGILTVEKAAEAKNCQRLKSKNAQLKQADETRGKALDEDRQAVAKLKSVLEKQLEESNASLRSAISSLMLAKRKLSHGSNETNFDSEEPFERPSELIVPDTIQNLSQVTELTEKLLVTEEKLSIVTEEKVKLEENLTATLLEFEKLDEFSRSLQSRYEAIHSWYTIFEDWDQSSQCNFCHSRIDVASIIDKRIEESKTTESAESDQDTLTNH